MKTKIILSCLTLALCFSACKKDKYQPKGDYVTTGTNVNTVKKYDFTVFTSDWSTGVNKSYTYYGIPTGTTMDGAVMVYYKGSTDNWYTALPFVINSTQSIQFAFKPSSCLLEVDLINMSAQLCDFRCVLIPPGSRHAHPEVDYTNYEQVKKVFSLKD